MKAQVLKLNGEKSKEIELPKIFSVKIRKDITKKVFESEKQQQPYGPDPRAGRKHSASGIIRHLRHVWKSGYGRGQSRIPKKIMWRRGSQFYWVGAEISSVRGGRQAHGPKIVHNLMKKKINKKEKTIAFASVIAATTKEEMLRERYSKLKNIQIKNLPLILDSNITKSKTGELVKGLEKLCGELFKVAVPEKKVRSGKGTRRNRKYKKSAGALIIIGNKEEMQTKTFEVKKVKEIEIGDLYPLGRLTFYTEEAIKDLENKK
jgi:large subunit ribosomal protein L4e